MGRLAAGLGLAAVLGILGCGAKGSLSGKVYYQDKVIPAGSVVFASEKTKEVFQSRIEEDGSYAITKIPPGTYKVGVRPAEMPKGMAANMPMMGGGGGGGKDAQIQKTNPIAAVGKEDAKNKGGGTGGLAPPPGTIFSPAQMADKFVTIPDQYKEPETSGLKVEVKGGKQVEDIKVP
jgi:hypothetical protein